MEESAQTPLQEGAIRKMTISILLVLSVGSAAYMISREPALPRRENLIDLSVRDIEIKPVVLTSAASDVERYIQDVFGVRVELPLVEDAKILAGAFEPRHGISIPTVLFDDPIGDVDRIFVFTYSLLDEWAAGVFLDRSVRLELENDGSYAVVTAADGREIVLWRSGDDIFLAVAQQGASRLISRIPS